MFSNPFRRKPAEAPAPLAVKALEKFPLHADSTGRFVIPNWARVEASLAERFAREDPNALWVSVAASWLDDLRIALGDGFRVSASENFFLLSRGDERMAKVFLDFAEKTRKRILMLLDGIANDEGYGKSCVLVFANEDDYYEYVANYYPDEGEFAFSSGMYINDGYGHFVCVETDMSNVEPIIAHELTHMQLTHLPLPAWLNEGLAVNTEKILSPRFGSSQTLAEMQAKHAAFWNAQTIQEFWSGKSFLRTDDGNELSYDLARQLTTLLSQDRTSFVKFANAVELNDGGQRAAQTHLGIGLELAVEKLLGEGDWQPNPSLWGDTPERGGFSTIANDPAARPLPC
jgi:hypothetical protein